MTQEEQHQADYWRSLGMPVYTKEQEYKRTIEMIPEIFEREGKNGTYFVLAFLYDSGYTNKDLKAMMDLCIPKEYRRKP